MHDASRRPHHVRTQVKPDAFAAFPKLSAFYARIAALDETKGVLAGTLNMPGPFKPYFVASSPSASSS
jgi:hypothetical protein